MTRRLGMPLLMMLAVLVLAAPAAARANGISSAIFATHVHLVVLNVGIAAVEAWVLARFAGFRFAACYKWILAANLVSTVVGAFPAFSVLPQLGAVWSGGFPQSGVVPWIIAAWAFAFVATILVEWPFVHRLRPDKALRWRWSLRWTIIVHLATYPPLALFYAIFHDTTLLTQVDIREDPAEFAAGPIGTLLYIDEGRVWAVRLDGTQRRPFELVVESAPQAQRLKLLGADEEDPDLIGLAGLPARGFSDDAASESYLLVGPFPGRAPVWEGEFSGLGSFAAYSANQRFLERRAASPGRPAVRLRRGELSIQRGDGRWRRLSTHTQLSGQPFGDSIVLPNGQVVLELPGRIFLFDPDGLRVAPLADGSSPTVFYGIEEFDALAHEGLDLIRYTTPARPSP